MMEYSSQLEQAENNVRVSIFGDDLKQLVEESIRLILFGLFLIFFIFKKNWLKVINEFFLHITDC